MNMKELRAHKIKAALFLREIFTRMLQLASVILPMHARGGLTDVSISHAYSSCLPPSEPQASCQRHKWHRIWWKSYLSQQHRCHVSATYLRAGPIGDGTVRDLKTTLTVMIKYKAFIT